MFTLLIETLQKSNKVALLTHINPDGDAICSCHAFGLLLKKLGKEYAIMSNEKVPEYLRFTGYQFSPPGELDSFDTVVALDCGDLDRLDGLQSFYQSVPTRICIDHHRTNPSFGDINIVDPLACSTGEILFDLVMELGMMDTDIATALYISIHSDSGGFVHSNMTEKTFQVLSKLITYNVPCGTINRMLRGISLKRLLLESDMMQTLMIYFGGKVVIGHLTTEMLTKYRAGETDGDAFIDTMRLIDGVEVAVLLKERTGHVKISMRSNSFLDVAAIAASMGGGGHIRAAGASYKAGLVETHGLMLEKLEPFFSLEQSDL